MLLVHLAPLSDLKNVASLLSSELGNIFHSTIFIQAFVISSRGILQHPKR